MSLLLLLPTAYPCHHEAFTTSAVLLHTSFSTSCRKEEPDIQFNLLMQVFLMPRSGVSSSPCILLSMKDVTGPCAPDTVEDITITTIPMTMVSLGDHLHLDAGGQPPGSRKLCHCPLVFAIRKPHVLVSSSC